MAKEEKVERLSMGKRHPNQNQQELDYNSQLDVSLDILNKENSPKESVLVPQSILQLFLNI